MDAGDPAPPHPLPLLRGRLPLWLAFAVVHGVLGVVALTHPSLPLGDVTLVYRFWVEQALTTGTVVGLDTAFVYPVAALVPMFAAAVFGLDAYAATWLTLVLVLDAVALAVLTGVRARRNVGAGWWWIAFTAALGPIAVARIDAVTVAVALTGVVVALERPRLAAALLALGAWIKVWPAALVAALLIALRARREVIAGAVTVTVAVVAVALLLGGGPRLLSFVTTQTDRGLQIESPLATAFLWVAAAGGDALVYYDREILTFQVSGPGTAAAAALATPLLALGVGAVLLLGVRAARRGVPASTLLPWLAFGLVAALIVGNKVGSPQFQSWFAVPVVLGLVTLGRRFAAPAMLALALAALTHVVYPYLYGALLATEPWMLVVISVRNALLVVALAWALAALYRLGSGGRASTEPARLDADTAAPRERP